MLYDLTHTHIKKGMVVINVDENEFKQMYHGLYTKCQIEVLIPVFIRRRNKSRRIK